MPITHVFVALPIAVVSCFSAAAAQSTIWVDGLNPNCPGSGTAADPYCTINGGMNAAVAGDVVVVRDGVYSGPGNEGMNFCGREFTVRSEHGPRNCVIELTGNAVAFWFVCYEGPSSRVEGFTIQGGNGLSGGAVFLHHGGSPTFVDCVFRDNTSPNGGAIFADDSPSPTFLRCRFEDNFATNGGAVYFNTSGAQPVFHECIFAGNVARQDGGALAFAGTTQATLVNCTLAGNSAAGAGGALSFGGFTASELTNCIVYGNGASPIAGAPTVTYSNVEGGFPGTGNLAANPQFLDAAGRDLRLDCTSPCVDAGTNLANLSATDFEGDARRVDGDSDGSSTADMGVDEFDMLWVLDGPAVVGGAPVNFLAQAPPAQTGFEAFVFLSYGDGSATGGIPVPNSGGRVLHLDGDALFRWWRTRPAAVRRVALAACPGSAALPAAVPASAIVGTRVFYAGVSVDPATLTVVSITPTNSFVLF